MERDKELSKLVNVLRRTARMAMHGEWTGSSEDAAAFCVDKYNRVLTRLRELEPAVAPIFEQLPDKSSLTVDGTGESLEHNCPGHQKNNFNIKQNKDHCDQVKLDREALARSAHRILATLVWHHLRARVLALADKLRKHNIAHSEASRDYEHQQDWQVVVKTKFHY